jgi:O-antigen/teichoic acid export membrane protein
MSRKGLLAVFNNGIEFLIGSLILVFVTKLFSVEESGVWIVFITILFMGTKFREGLIQSGLMKFSVGVSEQQRYNVYWISMLFTLGIELLLSLTAYAGSLLLHEAMLQVLLQHYYLLAVPQALFRMMQFIRQSELDVRSMAKANLFLLISVAIVLGFIHHQAIPFEMMPELLGFGYGIAILYQIMDLKVWKWKASLSKNAIPDGYLNYAFNGFLRELFGTLSSRAYIFLTAGLIGYTESALVGIASRYANLIYLPNSAYQGILYPKACAIVNRGMLKSMFLFYRRSVSWMQAAFIPYVFLLLTAGSAGIVILHGQAYSASLPYFIVLILGGAFISPFGHAFGSICQAAGRPELVTRLVMLNSVVNLMLAFLLVITVGVWGAVLSGIITDLVGLLFISAILKNNFNATIFEPVSAMIRRLRTLLLIFTRIMNKREAVL